MHRCEGRGREVVDLAQYRGHLVGEEVGCVVLARVEALDVAASAETFAFSTEDEGAGVRVGCLVEGVGKLGQVCLAERVHGLGIVEDEFGDAGLGINVEFNQGVSFRATRRNRW